MLEPTDAGPARPPACEDGTLSPGEAVNHELHHKKTFWVGEGLTTMLDQTDADVPGELLRVPFASFALVFTDRHFLGIAERMLAIEDEDATVAGQKLRVATVYVREAPEEIEPDREALGARALRITLAFDAFGSAWPYILSRVLPIDPTATLKEIVRAHLPTDGREDELVLKSGRLARLVNLVLNAVLYATSAGVEAKTLRRTKPKPKASSRRAPDHTSDDVFHLPGHIDIQLVRNVTAIARAPGGRQNPSSLHGARPLAAAQSSLGRPAHEMDRALLEGPRDGRGHRALISTPSGRGDRSVAERPHSDRPRNPSSTKSPKATSGAKRTSPKPVRSPTDPNASADAGKESP